MVRKKSQVVEANWLEYFRSIRNVCPWSLPAFQKDLIEIVRWQGYRIALEPPIEARVYICDLNPRRLKKLATDLENRDTLNEWLWSHPDFANHSTPHPCLIQQNRQRLTELRTKYSKKYSVQ